MHTMRFVCLLLFTTALFANGNAVRAPELLVLIEGLSLQTPANVATIKSIIDVGAASNYTGLVINDYGIAKLGFGIMSTTYMQRLQDIKDYAFSKNMYIVPGVWFWGVAPPIFEATNFQVAEPTPHLNASFVVESNSTAKWLSPRPCCASVPDGGFEKHVNATLTGWSWQDPRVVADTTVFHNGSCSAKFPAGTGYCRVAYANLPVLPWKMYHFRVYIKTEDFDGRFYVGIYDKPENNAFDYTLETSATQNWTAHDFVFSSMNSSFVYMYLIRTGTQGSVWADDVLIEEYPLYNVVQREGTPFRVYNPDTNQNYVPGKDYDVYNDPRAKTGYRDNWHTVDPLTLPLNSSLTPGTRVSIDYYSVPSYNHQIGACLTHPNSTWYMEKNTAGVSDAFSEATGIFFNYDEMRHMGSCELCRAAAPTAGQLLANHTTKSANLFRNYRNASGIYPNKNANFYYWSDMFDPFQNAVDHYHFVPTTIAGSWEGLPSDAIIFNWNLDNLNASLNWWNKGGYRQIVAGYYDSGTGFLTGQKEVNLTNGYSDILGFMYTTWLIDYTQMTQFAQGILSNWNPGPLSSSSTTASSTTASATAASATTGSKTTSSSTAASATTGSKTTASSTAAVTTVPSILVVLMVVCAILQ